MTNISKKFMRLHLPDPSSEPRALVCRLSSRESKLPIIARDIPVFREVAGDHAFYFRGSIPEALSQIA